MKKQFRNLLAIACLLLLGGISFGFTECPPDESSILPHEDDCSKYYVCSSGMAIEMSCPPDLEFNPNTLTCDWPELAGCESSGGAKKYKGVLCTCDDGRSGGKLKCTSGNLDPCTSTLSCYLRLVDGNGNDVGARLCGK